MDALYDIADVEMVAIDEPELSLHPGVQRRLAKLISEYAATNQIVISTHSPYFVNIEALGVGGRVIRVFAGELGSQLASLSPETGSRLYKASLDMNNPHVMGLDAREVFFLDDKIVLAEGQEDVMFFARALASVESGLNGTLFGWGAGGADKIELIAKVLDELSFTKVVGIVDADKAGLLPGLRERFPKFHFAAIPANDIRNKPAVPARAAKEGLLDEKNRNVRPEHRDAFKAIINDANAYFDGQPKTSN